MLQKRLGSIVLVVTSVLVACSADPGAPGGDDRPISLEPKTADAGAPSTSADHVEIVAGVPDRGRDPAVVAIDVGGEGLCSGALISPRLVLTARHCVSRTSESVACPPTGVQVFGDRRAGDLTVLLGEDIASARPVAHGAMVLTPGGVTLCDADIAVLVLDQPVTLVKPLPVRARGPATGDRVRAVGFGRRGDDAAAGTKLLREHVRVLSVTDAEFLVGEATCSGDSGGPALDEDTGEILGVVSRGGPSCEGKGVHNVYTRVDAFSWLVEEAFTRVSQGEVDELPDGGPSAPPKPAKRGTKQKPPSDVGGPCMTGDDCAAGVCITEETEGEPRRYCSRPCGSGDRCPTRYHCKPVAGLESGATACINVR